MFWTSLVLLLVGLLMKTLHTKTQQSAGPISTLNPCPCLCGCNPSPLCDCSVFIPPSSPSHSASPHPPPSPPPHDSSVLIYLFACHAHRRDTRWEKGREGGGGGGGGGGRLPSVSLSRQQAGGWGSSRITRSGVRGPGSGSVLVV